tara:strand:+ start:1041 stop:1208 length:168 start_codon:yes stop_codon:yes gene_type:complete
MSCSLPKNISTEASGKTVTVQNIEGDTKIDFEDLVIVTNTSDDHTDIYNVNPFDL